MATARQTLPLSYLISADDTRASARVFVAGVAATSFAALLIELALTRLFSVVLYYHFAFLAISIALLGSVSYTHLTLPTILLV